MNNFEKRIEAFRLKHGRAKAKEKFLKAGISNSVSEKLLSRCYPHKPTYFLEKALMKVLK